MYFSVFKKNDRNFVKFFTEADGNIQLKIWVILQNFSWNWFAWAMNPGGHLLGCQQSTLEKNVIHNYKLLL